MKHKHTWIVPVFTAISFIVSVGAAGAQSLSPNDRLCTGPDMTRADNPPVYLLEDAQSIYRIEVSATANNIRRVAVTTGEIESLCVRGLEVRVLPLMQSEATSPAPASPLTCNTVVVPGSFTIIRLYGNVYGAFCTTATRPAGKTTQWLDFTMKSTSFNGTGLHAPIALFLNGAALSGSSPAIIGNGILIGDVHLRAWGDGGCGSTSWPSYPIYDSQIEAYWSTSNWIYGSTCDLYGAFDGTSYSWDIQANVNSWISYTKIGAGHTYSPPAVYTLNQRPSFDPNQGGLLFAVTNDVPGVNFRLDFSAVTTGWF